MREALATLPSARGSQALLDRYTPGESSLLASPARTMLAHGVRAVVGSEPRGLAARAQATLQTAIEDGSPPFVIGSLPFDPTAPAHLVVPEAVELAGPLALWPDERATSVLASKPRTRTVPSPKEYANSVAVALGRLRLGDMRKVVLARALEISGGGEVDVPALLRNLAIDGPGTYLFALDLSLGDVPPRTFVGASPELLVRRRGREVSLMPLAGTAIRHPDPLEDATRGAALLRSVKDRDEHEVVVSSVVEALGPLCDVLERPAGPELTRTQALWHLGTRLRGRLADPDITSLGLATALHPTPAVCGMPVAAAHAAIRELEPLDRGAYAGAVGWEDGDGDGEWAVAIRCGEVIGDQVRLWAGAGIVAASDPEAELAETQGKYATLLRALGLSEAA